MIVAGFCWSGSQSFRFATNNKEIRAALVFYGTGPVEERDIARIKCPVHGYYGANDARVTATVSQSADLMKKAGKTYEPVTYEGAGYGFMRAGEASERQRSQQEGSRPGVETLEGITPAPLSYTSHPGR